MGWEMKANDMCKGFLLHRIHNSIFLSLPETLTLYASLSLPHYFERLPRSTFIRFWRRSRDSSRFNAISGLKMICLASACRSGSFHLMDFPCLEEFKGTKSVASTKDEVVSIFTFIFVDLSINLSPRASGGNLQRNKSPEMGKIFIWTSLL